MLHFRDVILLNKELEILNKELGLEVLEVDDNIEEAKLRIGSHTH